MAFTTLVCLTLLSFCTAAFCLAVLLRNRGRDSRSIDKLLESGKQQTLLIESGTLREMMLETVCGLRQWSQDETNPARWVSQQGKDSEGVITVLERDAQRNWTVERTFLTASGHHSQTLPSLGKDEPVMHSALDGLVQTVTTLSNSHSS